MTKQKTQINLGNAKISKLILTFAIPSILSHLVASIYNIVDQIFIGQNIGTEGTAASQVAYMLVLFMTACYVLISTGTASKFSLDQGKGESKEKQGRTVGNGVVLLIAVGIVLMAVVLIAKKPILKLLGAGDNETVLDLAMQYTWIIAIGMPFQMFAAGSAIIIRADGSPTYSMLTSLSGAVLNIGLDALFMMGFHMGMHGAALATIIGQIFSAGMAFAYFFRFKSLKFKLNFLKPNGEAIGQIFRLGLAAGLMQFAIMIVQTVMNNMLRKYGETDLVNSVITSEIPDSYLTEAAGDVTAASVAYASATALAVAGVVAKINSIFNATIYGICQSVQPVFGYNYGAKRYKRVFTTFIDVVIVSLIVGLVAFTLFQAIPKPILHIFQKGDPLYNDFGTQYLRIFMGAVFLTAIPIAVSNFFPSINMPVRGIIASISRQIIFQLPLIIIFPLIWGMNGVLYAGVTSDTCAAILCAILVIPTLVKLWNLSKQYPVDDNAPVENEKEQSGNAPILEENEEIEVKPEETEVEPESETEEEEKPEGESEEEEKPEGEPEEEEKPEGESEGESEKEQVEEQVEESFDKAEKKCEDKSEDTSEEKNEDKAPKKGDIGQHAISPETDGEKKIRYNHSFKATLIQTTSVMQQRYGQIADEIASYPKAKTRDSWKNITVYFGRNTIAKLLFKGKTLCIAYALNPEDYENTRYFGQSIQGKKYEKTPMLLKLTSQRKVSNAKYLLRQAMEKAGVPSGEKVESGTFSLPYETNEELYEKGLVKPIK